MRRPDVLAVARSSTGTPDLRLSLLGGFDLTVDGADVRVADGSQQLLAYLALSHRAVRRMHVAGVIWGDVPDVRAGGNLRSTLWRLRHLDLDLIAGDSECLRLSPGVTVDVHEADRLARLVFDPQSDVSNLEVEGLPFCADLLPGWDFDWVLLARERLRQIGLHVLDALCQRWTEEARYDKAIKAGLAAVASEPLRETSHRALIGAFVAEGNRPEAIRRFTLYCDVLRRELNLAPSASLRALVSSLAAE